ncbi:MAG TPA: hypothetical protein PLE54_06715 [Burkholderiaceae bacterium]|nr:hypothetical protein [Burkholderiaceae bacterium]HQR70277.1 hypothetical protein [Burkholderiaceae bacterium]
MTTHALRICPALVLAAAFTASANAEYRCASASTSIDQRACAAAEKGPDALRRYVQSWDKQIAGLQFSDYVDEKTAQSWEAKSRVARQPDADTGVKVASSEPR